MRRRDFIKIAANLRRQFLLGLRDLGSWRKRMSPEAGILLIDLENQSRKQIKRLRQGIGKLVDQVQNCLQELRGSRNRAGIGGPSRPARARKTSLFATVLGVCVESE